MASANKRDKIIADIEVFCDGFREQNIYMFSSDKLDRFIDTIREKAIEEVDCGNKPEMDKVLNYANIFHNNFMCYLPNQTNDVTILNPNLFKKTCMIPEDSEDFKTHREMSIGVEASMPIFEEKSSMNTKVARKVISRIEMDVTIIVKPMKKVPDIEIPHLSAQLCDVFCNSMYADHEVVDQDSILAFRDAIFDLKICIPNFIERYNQWIEKDGFWCWIVKFPQESIVKFSNLKKNKPNYNKDSYPVLLGMNKLSLANSL